jgi:hypothetical protein
MLGLSLLLGGCVDARHVLMVLGRTEDESFQTMADLDDDNDDDDDASSSS